MWLFLSIFDYFLLSWWQISIMSFDFDFLISSHYHFLSRHFADYYFSCWFRFSLSIDSISHYTISSIWLFLHYYFRSRWHYFIILLLRHYYWLRWLFTISPISFHFLMFIIFLLDVSSFSFHFHSLSIWLTMVCIIILGDLEVIIYDMRHYYIFSFSDYFVWCFIIPFSCHFDELWFLSLLISRCKLFSHFSTLFLSGTFAFINIS